MAHKLAGLHSQLSALCWRRYLTRLVHGGLAVGVALGLGLAVTFLLDWQFRLGVSERAGLLVVLAGLGLWSLRKYLWPAVGSRETIIDLALQVERHHRIDSDLVAALQFEAAPASAWGSPQLTTAVVERVSTLGRELPVGRGLAETRLGPRGIKLAVVVLGWLAVAGLYPRHTAAFLERLLLGAAHYPTRTSIARIVINGVEAFPARTAGATVRIPYAPNLLFTVEARDELPATGEVRLTAESGTLSTTVLLTPDEAPDRFTGELPRATDNLGFQVFLGDAWSEPGRIAVILPPVITMELDYTPPAYAAQARSTRATGNRQLAVLEGSRVGLALHCSNKPLASAKLIVGDERFPLEAVDAEQQTWRLAGKSPLDEVTAGLTFEIHAVDGDGLSPEQPLRGQIYLQADRAPRIAGAVVTEKVLPQARPSIAWGAADDNGLAEIRLVKQVTRASGEVVEISELVQQIPADKQPVPALRGRHVVDLKPLGLVKGDEVRVTLEAIDYRGGRPGTLARSEPIAFQVTDESGILAGLVEADEKSARQLDQIIQRQLGIGEAR